MKGILDCEVASGSPWHEARCWTAAAMQTEAAFWCWAEVQARCWTSTVSKAEPALWYRAQVQALLAAGTGAAGREAAQCTGMGDCTNEAASHSPHRSAAARALRVPKGSWGPCETI